MALDGPLDSDEVFTEHGVRFIVDKGLFEEVKPISVDFVQSAMGEGFMLRSALSAKNDGGCGGGTCGGGTCGS